MQVHLHVDMKTYTCTGNFGLMLSFSASRKIWCDCDHTFWSGKVKLMSWRLAWCSQCIGQVSISYSIGIRWVACDTISIQHDQFFSLASLSGLLPSPDQKWQQTGLSTPAPGNSEESFPLFLLHPEQNPLIELSVRAQSLFTAPSSVTDLWLLSTNVLIT